MAVKFFRGRLGWTIKWSAVLLVTLLLLTIVLLDVVKVGSVPLPPAVRVDMTTIDQGWNPGWEVGQSQWFHHADQGTKILNYDWFTALEQPDLSLLSKPGKFSDPEYLQRFGFIPSTADERMNPHGLPIGFALNRNFQEPQSDAPPPYPVVGLTCAACHTGQINYHGKGIRIEGGSGMVDLGRFKSALGRAIYFTRISPWRFDRFARSVLGDQYSAETKAQLGKEVDNFLAKGSRDKTFADSQGLYALEGGFSRTDALGLILNRVFDQVNQENANVADAPVNFPHIWDSSWFDWVQYNASIRTPMARNIGEVLGVGGMINLPGSAGESWKSTVNVSNLHLMEQQLSGAAPYDGLRSPKWPEDILGPLDRTLVKRGAELYVTKKCHTCHWRVEDVQTALTDKNGQGGPNHAQMWTTKNSFGKQFINTAETVINVERIGTDPSAAINFTRRVVVIVNGRELSVAGGKLDYVTNRVREVEYQKLGLLDKFGKPIEATMDIKVAYDAYRLPWEEFLDEKVTSGVPVGEPDDRTMAMVERQIDNQRESALRLGYKARPLNGIWATAPYLHNSSVPTLYQLLSPIEERDVQFNLGSKEFDPVNVGYIDEKLTGSFVMDTTLAGNHNTGHEFRGSGKGAVSSPWVKGVLGPTLTHEERMAIIEYLKSL